MMAFFQTRLEKNFGYEDDQVVDSLTSCMNELRRMKLLLPPPATDASEHPAKPFGLFVPPSVEQAIGRKILETERERVISGRRSLLRASRLSISIPPDGGPEFVEGTEVGSLPMIAGKGERLSSVGFKMEWNSEQTMMTSPESSSDQSKSAVRPSDLNVTANRRATFAKTKLDPIENESPAEDTKKTVVANGSPTVAMVAPQKPNGDVGKKGKGKGKRPKGIVTGGVGGGGGGQATVYLNQSESSAPQQYGASVRL